MQNVKPAAKAESGLSRVLTRSFDSPANGVSTPGSTPAQIGKWIGPLETSEPRQMD